MKIKTTKRALIASALSLLLCASMLIGTTFAWFTDDVTSAKNKIESGNLDVELYYAMSAEDALADKWTKLDENTDIYGYDNWEPGYTEVAYFKVVNEGSLALKYQLSADVYKEESGINKDGDVFFLSDYIYTKLVDTSATRDSILASTDGKLLKNTIAMSDAASLNAGESAVVGLALWMPTSVGNEANHNGTDIPSIEFGINLVATQKTFEEDSFGNDYDENAWHDAMKVYSAADLAAAISNSTKAVVMNDIILDSYVTVPAGASAILDLNGNTVSAVSGNVIRNNGDLTVMNGTLEGTTTYTINNVSGNVTVKNVKSVNGGFFNGGNVMEVENCEIANTASGKHALVNSGSAATKTVINGGTYSTTSGNEILKTYSGTLEVNSGNFEQIGSSYMLGGSIVINGGTFKDDDGKWAVRSGDSVVINGGTFNFDPTNFVADGSVAMDNGDGTYTAIAEISGVTLNTVAGYPALYTDGTDYYTYTATGLISMRNFWKAKCYENSMWGKSYNVMADIDATGYTWDEVWVIVGNNANDGFIFDGHGHTVKGLTINGSLFSGTPNGGNAGAKPGYVKDITFDGATVIGDHFAGVLWSSTYGDLAIENVKVINSEIIGSCNVAALIGGTSQESGDVNITFKNCVVENNTIIANGKNGQDPNGANAFISRAYADANLVFEGENVAKNNEIVNNNGLVGGGIYGYTVWMDGGFIGTDTCDSFTNWNGLVFERVEGVKGLYKIAEKCYGVTTAEGLAKINEWFCGTAAEKTTILKIDLFADIDMTGKTWNTVGWNQAYKFEEIDGNGYTISNMKISGNAMFANFGGADVAVTDLTFDNATVSTSSINSAIIVGQTYVNLTLDNVDVINSSVTGGYKVAVLVGSVHDDSATTGNTLTVKNCDIDNCTVTTVSYDFDTCGIVAFVYAGENEKVVFENTTISNTKLMCTNSAGYNLHAFVYGTEANWYNEAEGVTVTNVTFANI